MTEKAKEYLNHVRPGAQPPLAETDPEFVDRFASFQRDWQADYRRGVTILADRYVTANLIYQMGKLPRPDWESYLRWVEDLEYGKLGLPRPDRVLYLEMPLEVSQRLLTQRYRGHEEKKDIHEKHLDFLRQCRECASFAAQRQGWIPLSCAENGQPLSVEEIHRRVMAALEDLW